jgi:hypothetical protein
MRMQQTKRAGAVVAVLAGGLVAAGCSAEKIGEGVAERMIEDACEDEGTECNIDIDGDSVQFETEDGSMTVDEDGNAVIVGPDGSVVEVNADADGEITMTDGDGSVVMQQDDESMTISGAEGDATYSVGGELPAEFPSSIELPDGATVASSTVIGDPSAPGGGVMISLLAPGDLADVAAAAAAGVEAGGYSQVSKTEVAEGHFYLYEGNGQSVTLSVSPDGAGSGQLVVYNVSATT